MRKVAPNGWAARIFLAFLATAGLFYVNIMPAIVDGLMEGLSFSSRQAGFVGSANVYGAAAGALTIVFLIGRVRWRLAAYTLLTTLILMDLLSMLVELPPAMIAIRFVHGLVGGALVGVGFAIIARTVNPDRTFGILLVVQFGLGGLGNLYLPRLAPVFGADVLFLALIAFSILTAAMVPFLDDYEVRAPAAGLPDDGVTRPGALALVLGSIFLFQAANMGLFAFIIGLGKAYGLDLEFITITLAISGWLGILGAVAVVVLYTRFGRTAPLAVALVLTVVLTLALHRSDLPWVFLAANIGIGLTWAFVMSYLLGLASEFDLTGRMAALGGFASKMGLASGPMVAGMLLRGDDYGPLITLAAAAIAVSTVAALIPARIQDAVPARTVTVGAEPLP